MLLNLLIEISSNIMCTNCRLEISLKAFGREEGMVITFKKGKMVPITVKAKSTKGCRNYRPLFLLIKFGGKILFLEFRFP